MRNIVLVVDHFYIGEKRVVAYIRPIYGHCATLHSRHTRTCANKRRRRDARVRDVMMKLQRLKFAEYACQMTYKAVKLTTADKQSACWPKRAGASGRDYAWGGGVWRGVSPSYWGWGLKKAFFNFQVKMQGFVHFIEKKLLVARNRDRRRWLNRPPGAEDVKCKGSWKFSRGFNSPNLPSTRSLRTSLTL